MRLLILTQKVDKNDPILGFFHKWLIEFASKFESIKVVCLEMGDYDLPSNVKVFSLGKEKIAASSQYLISRIKYVFNFYKLIWAERKNYDAVFVHMNQEYVVLGGLFWRALGKIVFLWRNHPKGNIFTHIAAWFCKNVFYTSKSSFTTRFKNSRIMPVGIDTLRFCPDKSIAVIPNSILSLGRISPIKNIDKIIDAAFELHKRGVDFILDIVGDPVNPEDKEYMDLLLSKSQELVDRGLVNFLPAVSQEGAAVMFKSHKIFVNLTPPGSLDKTIFEAAACGCIPLVANTSLKGEIGDTLIIENNSPELLTSKIQKILSLSTNDINIISNGLRKFVIERHSLVALIDKLVKEF